MRTGRVPPAAASFVGRARELRQVEGLLRRYQVVTLIGPGGVGKTSLGLAVARRSVRRSKDDAWLAELAGVTNPAHVPDRVADAVLGISGSSGSGVTEIAERAAGRPALLILDNCEHLVDAVARFTAALVTAVPNLRIIATSREPLRIAAEATFPVPPMPDDESLLLFIERAKARAPGFFPLDDARAAVREICTRLDGLPLAIELAAARMAILSPAQLLPLLSDRFSVLDAGPRDAPSRHRALRAAIDWSFELLGPGEQELFLRLSVFRGGFDLSAAATLAGAVALGTLTALVEKSVVQPLGAVGANPRYRMLDTLREYGLERLAAGGMMDEAQLGCLQYFVQRAESTFVEGLVIGPAVQVAELESDLDNLRSALEWSLDAAPGLGLRLVGAARDLWFMRAQADGLRFAKQLLEREIAPDAYRARALATAGQLANTMQRTGEATAFLQEACDISRSNGAARQLAWATWTLGVAGFLGEDPGAAARSLVESRAMFERIGDRTGQGRATASLGTVLFLSGELEEARATLTQALAVAEEVVDQFGQGLCHLYLGLAAGRAGDRTDAGTHLRAAIGVLAAVGDNTLLTLALAGLALNLDRADRRRALRLASAATVIRGWIGGDFAPFMTDSVTGLRSQGESELGAAAAAAEWEAGRSLGVPEALALALGGAARIRPSAEPVLSRREMEVARLVAEGLGNRAIADALHLSTRTVENHVFHVMSKVGLDNRTQVAVWVASSR
ncbi:MAG: LuxR C-terminal-related transcriptional regulator [Candidatus Dormibacteria bacterium]